MRALGAAEDAVQLRSILAFADIAAGRLDEAARVIEEIVVGRAHRQPRSAGASPASPVRPSSRWPAVTSTVDCGSTSTASTMATERRIGSAGSSTWLMPWVLFAESSALFAHVCHGRREEARWLAERLREKLPRAAG